MDIHSSSWQVAVEVAGIWPSTVVLGPHEAMFLLLYRRSNGEERVLTVAGRTLTFADLGSLSRFLVGPHTGVPDDVHLALEILSSLAPRALASELFPSVPVGQSILWIAGGGTLAPEGRAARLLGTLAFLNDWHDSLQEHGVVGPWPQELDEAAEILTDVVVTHEVTSQEAAQALVLRNLRPVLVQEIGELLRSRV